MASECASCQPKLPFGYSLRFNANGSPFCTFYVVGCGFPLALLNSGDRFVFA